MTGLELLLMGLILAADSDLQINNFSQFSRLHLGSFAMLVPPVDQWNCVKLCGPRTCAEQNKTQVHSPAGNLEKISGIFEPKSYFPRGPKFHKIYIF